MALVGGSGRGGGVSTSPSELEQLFLVTAIKCDTVQKQRCESITLSGIMGEVRLCIYMQHIPVIVISEEVWTVVEEAIHSAIIW